MNAITNEFMGALKGILKTRYVPDLPELLENQTPEQNKNKQISRAFSAFVLQSKLGISAREAAQAVVDDFKDNGIDAIYYDESTEILYLVQSKLKVTESFKQADAQAFVDGIRLLIKQQFSEFNANVKNRTSEIELALDTCSHIVLVVAYTGDGISDTAITVIKRLISDEDLQEERFNEDISHFTAEDVVTALRIEQAYQPVNTKIKLQKYQKISEPREAYYGVAKLEDLASLHKQYGKELYEKNIRYYLGTRSNVNQSIKATLANNPCDFLLLNTSVYTHYKSLILILSVVFRLSLNVMRKNGLNPPKDNLKFIIRMVLSILNMSLTLLQKLKIAF